MASKVLLVTSDHTVEKGLVNIVRLQPSSICCKKYSRYYESDKCRPDQFSDEQNVYVRLLSPRTNKIAVVRDFI